jgi:hypothetical protein
VTGSIAPRARAPGRAAPCGCPALFLAAVILARGRAVLGLTAVAVAPFLCAAVVAAPVRFLAAVVFCRHLVRSLCLAARCRADFLMFSLEKSGHEAKDF